MTFAHVMGMPLEESALALAPAGAAIVSGVALFARSELAGIVGWLQRSKCGPRRDAARSSYCPRAHPRRGVVLHGRQARDDGAAAADRAELGARTGETFTR